VNHIADRRLLQEAADLWREFAAEERAFFSKRHIHRRPNSAEHDAREDAHRIDVVLKQDEPIGPPEPLYLEITGRR